MNKTNKHGGGVRVCVAINIAPVSIDDIFIFLYLSLSLSLFFIHSLFKEMMTDK
jgi:hypothetical protein